MERMVFKGEISLLLSGMWKTHAVHTMHELNKKGNSTEANYPQRMLLYNLQHLDLKGTSTWYWTNWQGRDFRQLLKATMYVRARNVPTHRIIKTFLNLSRKWRQIRIVWSTQKKDDVTVHAGEENRYKFETWHHCMKFLRRSWSIGCLCKLHSSLFRGSQMWSCCVS